jgi:hypothetical protein
VIDHVHVLEQSPEFGAIVYVSARKMNIGRERVSVAGRKVIESADLVSLLRKVVGESRAEKTGGSGD